MVQLYIKFRILFDNIPEFVYCYYIHTKNPNEDAAIENYLFNAFCEYVEADSRTNPDAAEEDRWNYEWEVITRTEFMQFTGGKMSITI